LSNRHAAFFTACERGPQPATHFVTLLAGYAAKALATANGQSLCPPEDEVRRFIDRLLCAEGEAVASLGGARPCASRAT
jgi:hypothetical protein